ncbi:MAG: transposase, partial [Symploca sp. SIO2E6]|nr:transposase [Symploca sp. SIO2E6]
SKELNEARLSYMLAQTEQQRKKRKDSVLLIDDTLCEHVGSLFDYVDRHYNHANQSYPLAHNLVTAHYVSGAVRFPIDYRLYRRYEEYTDWESYAKKHYPDEAIPKKKKDRAKFRRKIEPTLLTDSDFLKLHQSFATKIELSVQLVETALTNNVPFDTVLFDSWYLSKDLLAVLKKHNKNWISILKQNRVVATQSFALKDEAGEFVQFERTKMQIKEIIPLIPASAFRPTEVDGTTYYVFTKNLSLTSLGKVRLVISFDNAECQGNPVVLVTNCLSWNAKKIIATYLCRWPIETFYQDSKQLLGLDEYRMRSSQAIEKHWSLSFVAYSFLHLDCLPLSNGKQNCLSLSSSLGSAVRRQQKAAIQSLILYAHHFLQAGKDISRLFDHLFAKQSLSFC